MLLPRLAWRTCAGCRGIQRRVILTQIKRGSGQKHTLSFMKRRYFLIAAGLLGLGLAGSAASQSTTVGGIVVNFGIVPAEVALRVDGHRDSHPTNPPAGSQHLLVTLDDANSGKRIGDAEVAIEVKDPHGRVDTKPLLHTQGGGLPDYSELFEFRWSGDYEVRVLITTKPGAKPIEARFTVHHAV